MCHPLIKPALTLESLEVFGRFRLQALDVLHPKMSKE